MVDEIQIRRLFHNWFDSTGWVSVDPVSAAISVQGDVQQKDQGIGKLGGAIYLSYPTMRKLPVTFKEVKGDFIIGPCGLKTLAGFPQIVGGNFKVEGNDLTSLQGGPTHVGKNYNVSNNKLTSLAGAPQHVLGNFKCYQNNLQDLTGGPVRVEGGMICDGNELTSLAGAPEHVGGTFKIDYKLNLPLLKLCLYKNFILSMKLDQVQEILVKYAGSGRPGALMAAAELIRAGYKENARW